MAQRALDSTPRAESDLCHDTIWLVGLLIHELTEALRPSAEAAALLWQIASRVLETRCATLAIAEPRWCRSLGDWRNAFKEHAIDLLPERAEHLRMQIVKPHRAQNEPSEGPS